MPEKKTTTPPKNRAKAPPKKDTKGGTKKPPARPRRKPLGTALSIIQKNQRDRLIGMRRVQGLSWELIAREVGMTVQGAKNAHLDYVKANPNEPDFLSADPLSTFKELMGGLALSIGDFEGLALAAIEQGNLASAVGAKKAANEAREKILTIQQELNLIPSDLGQFRHLMDLREIATRTIDLIEAFERGEASPGDVREGFYEMLGISTGTAGEEELVEGEIAA